MTQYRITCNLNEELSELFWTMGMLVTDFSKFTQLRKVYLESRQHHFTDCVLDCVRLEKKSYHWHACILSFCLWMDETNVLRSLPQIPLSVELYLEIVSIMNIFSFLSCFFSTLFITATSIYVSCRAQW